MLSRAVRATGTWRVAYERKKESVYPIESIRSERERGCTRLDKGKQTLSCAKEQSNRQQRRRIRKGRSSSAALKQRRPLKARNIFRGLICLIAESRLRLQLRLQLQLNEEECKCSAQVRSSRVEPPEAGRCLCVCVLHFGQVRARR